MGLEVEVYSSLTVCYLSGLCRESPECLHQSRCDVHSIRGPRTLIKLSSRTFVRAVFMKDLGLDR